VTSLAAVPHPLAAAAAAAGRQWASGKQRGGRVNAADSSRTIDALSIYVEEVAHHFLNVDGSSGHVVRMMLIRVPLQPVAAVAAAAVPQSASHHHRMIAYIDSDAVDKTSSSAAAAAAASSIKVSRAHAHVDVS